MTAAVQDGGAAPGRPAAQTLVMKFGGTSVADVERLRAVAARLVAARDTGARVVGVLSAMGDTTDELLALADRMSPRPKPRALDMMISVGERISCALAEMAIEDMGRHAISLTGSQAGIVTDTIHGKAKVVDVRARRVEEALDAGAIVLVAGFQGVSTEREVTTLGRGGSNLTAVALAAALGADACEMYTDVDGVFTADPRVVPGARKLDAVGYDEMLELAASGANVLQLRSVELAAKQTVRIHVRSSFTDAEGTWVGEEDGAMLENDRVAGIAHTTDEVLYRVTGVEPAALLRELADVSVNVDTLVHAGGELVFSAPRVDRADTEAVLDRLGGTWSARDDLGKVSVVGAGLKSNPGIAARALASLASLGIRPEAVSASPIKLACHVPAADLERAVAALHGALELEAVPGA